MPGDAMHQTHPSDAQAMHAASFADNTFSHRAVAMETMSGGVMLRRNMRTRVAP
jgi:hypothetical protein